MCINFWCPPSLLFLWLHFLLCEVFVLPLFWKVFHLGHFRAGFGLYTLRVTLAHVSVSMLRHHPHQHETRNDTLICHVTLIVHVNQAISLYKSVGFQPLAVNLIYLKMMTDVVKNMNQRPSTRKWSLMVSLTLWPNSSHTSEDFLMKTVIDWIVFVCLIGFQKSE